MHRPLVRDLAKSKKSSNSDANADLPTMSPTSVSVFALTAPRHEPGTSVLDPRLWTRVWTLERIHIRHIRASFDADEHIALL